MSQPINVRPAEVADLKRLTEIYNYYVINTNITLDSESWTIEQRRKWFDQYSSAGPHRLLVAESSGILLGSASSSQYRSHRAFAETVEFGIYLAPEARGRGVGKLLYAALFKAVHDEKIHLVVAGVALPNDASVALHRSFGFSEVGVFSEYAAKNGNYISSIWFQKLVNTS